MAIRKPNNENIKEIERISKEASECGMSYGQFISAIASGRKIDTNVREKRELWFENPGVVQIRGTHHEKE